MATDTATTATQPEDLELNAPDLSLLELILSDHLAAREWSNQPEPRWRSLALMVPRILLNPSLLLAFSVRLAQKGPRLLQYPIRWLQLVMFSSEIYWFGREGSIEIGPGVVFPHPANIMIGPGTRIGSDVRIYHCCTMGTDRNVTVGEYNLPRAPRVGDRAVLYGFVVLQGPYEIGHDAAVGVRVVVDEDVPPGALKTLRRMRLRGEWPGVNG